MLGQTSCSMPLVRDAVGLHELLIQSGIDVQIWHIEAHAGHALNECADCLAKLACQGWRFMPSYSYFDALLQDGVMTWLWLAQCQASEHADNRWPHIDQDTGSFACVVGVVGPSVAHSGLPPYTKEASETTTSRSCLSVIPYNVTTLKGSAQQVALDSAFTTTALILLACKNVGHQATPKRNCNASASRVLANHGNRNQIKSGIF